MEKYYRGDYISTKELLIGDPDTINTEINNELCESRELVSKYTVLLMEERKKTGELEKKIEKFKEYIENKKKGNHYVDIFAFNLLHHKLSILLIVFWGCFSIYIIFHPMPQLSLRHLSHPPVAS